MLELSVNQLMKYMGINLILKDVTFNVYEGDRVGLIGSNGSGKSTILKLLAGIIKLKLFKGSWSKGYDYGFISIPKEAKVAYLDQAPSYDDALTVIEVIQLAYKNTLDIEKKLRNLESKMATMSGSDLDRIMENYSRLTHAFEAARGYEIQENISRVCSGLAFDEEFLKKPFGLLSGGEKTRVELGKILVHQPDILLLVEPTNHLDDQALEWLENFLKTYKGIVMIVSHDRYFLDQVTNKILEIEDLTTKMYKGNFSKYKEEKDEFLRIQSADYKEQQKQIKNMKKQIHDLRQWALQSDNNKFFQRAASIEKKLEKMNKIKRPVLEKRNMHLNLDVKNRSGNEVIIAKDLSKTYDGVNLFNLVNFKIYYQERVGLLGPNGCGKSTLLKLLMGHESPTFGSIAFGASARVAYLPQHICFENEALSVLETLKDTHIMSVSEAREYLAKYMFYGKSVFTKVSDLSGGESIRLKLALLLYEDVNVLILDEPTNHLDIESIETLEAALMDFKGTIFFISHDRYFINKMSDRLYGILNHQVIDFEDYEAYKIASQNEAINQPRVIEKISKEKKKPKIHYEEEIEAIEAKVNLLERNMISEVNQDKLEDLQNKKDDLLNQLEKLYSEWII